VLKSAVGNARFGREEELRALKRLDEQARLLEHHASGPYVEGLIAQEKERSHLYGGRSVFRLGTTPRQLRRNRPWRDRKRSEAISSYRAEGDQRSNGMERGA